MRILLATLGALALSVALSMPIEAKKSPNGEATQLTNNVTKRSFGADAHGEAIDEYTLTNSRGMSAKVITFGATLRELLVPDRHNKKENIVLGFDNIGAYQEVDRRPYFGATIGRYANRIAGAQFSLDNKEYRLAPNNGHNTLHGGVRGFDMRCWKADPILDSKEPALKLTYVSKDMEEGFPGTLTISVIYKLTDDNALRLDYEATTDKSTPVNFTNHTYFNLRGAGISNVLHHELQVNADEYLPVDKELIPLGKPASVRDTPFDFTNSKEIGRDISETHGGYDHNFNLRSTSGELAEAAIASEPDSGRVLHMFTTEPAVQIYTGNGLDGTVRGVGGDYRQYYGFTLEAQHYPDSVHHPEYPNTILKPGQVYKQTTVYKFSTKPQ